MARLTGSHVAASVDLMSYNLPLVFPLRHPNVARAFGHAERHLFPSDRNAVNAQPRPVGMENREQGTHWMLRGSIHVLGPHAVESVAI
jgi:hypothetical protein